MKKHQLEELVRTIVHNLLKEYDAAMSTSDLQSLADKNPDLDASTPPQDAMTSAEKARMNRQDQDEKKKEIKQATVELDATKKKLEYQRREQDSLRRFTIPDMTKKLQSLKGATST